MFSDRSRLMEYQRCPRSRYLGYQWGGTGIRRIRQSIPLATGQFVHVGLEDLLRQVMAMEDQPHAHLRVDVERAVKAAVDGYQKEVQARGLDVELGEDGQAVADEQIALTEGLVRAYVKAPTGLQALLSQYRIVEVEREDVWERFTEPDITFQSRADALLQERSSGDLYVLSLKTAATNDWRKDNENRHDVQGLSEVAVIERRLRTWYENWQRNGSPKPSSESGVKHQNWSDATCGIFSAIDSPPRIMGVQMVFLVKGQRRQAYDGGPYQTASHLLKGYYKEDVTDREYAWKSELPCPGAGMHVVAYTKKGPKLCEGKKFHKLGVDWHQFDTWRGDGSMGVKEWIDMLASGTVQVEAGDPFGSVVWMPLPYFRQDQDMQDWVEQAQAQEQLVTIAAADVERTRVEAPQVLRRLLNISFPQYRRACDWPSACQFIPICFGDETGLTNPFGTGMFQARQPHHQAELDAMQISVDTPSK